MSIYEVEVGDRVKVDIIKNGYWVNMKRGEVTKITDKRISVLLSGDDRPRAFVHMRVTKA